jgi:hypothetical protein
LSSNVGGSDEVEMTRVSCKFLMQSSDDVGQRRWRVGMENPDPNPGWECIYISLELGQAHYTERYTGKHTRTDPKP